jgi:serine/threonine protein kinase
MGTSVSIFAIIRRIGTTWYDFLSSYVSEMYSSPYPVRGNRCRFMLPSPTWHYPWRLERGTFIGTNDILQCHGIQQYNVLITNGTPPQACLADFGLSTLAPSTGGATTTITTGGTLLYMAPELLFPSKFGNASARPTMPADIYALGMVIFEVLTGSLPFHERKWPIVEIFYHVMGGERPAKPGDVGRIGFGNGTWELVEECWLEEPAKRPTVERVVAHLTRVAASSTVVGPTPGGSSRRFDSSGTALFSPARNPLTLAPKVTHNR